MFPEGSCFPSGYPQWSTHPRRARRTPRGPLPPSGPAGQFGRWPSGCVVRKLPPPHWEALQDAPLTCTLKTILTWNSHSSAHPGRSKLRLKGTQTWSALSLFVLPGCYQTLLSWQVFCNVLCVVCSSYPLQFTAPSQDAAMGLSQASFEVNSECNSRLVSSFYLRNLLFYISPSLRKLLI